MKLWIALAILVLGTSACAARSPDPFDAKIKAGHFTKRERDYAARIADLVYGRSTSKLMTSYFTPVSTDLILRDKCFNSLQPRIFYIPNPKPGGFGLGYSGHYSFEADSGGCKPMGKTFSNNDNAPTAAFGVKTTSGKWIERKALGFTVWFQIKDKKDESVPSVSRSMDRYSGGYFSKSTKCNLDIKRNRYGTGISLATYIIETDRIKHVRQSKDEPFDQYRALPQNQYVELTDTLSKDPEFVECYMRAHLVAVGMEGGAFLPKNYIMRSKPDGTAGYCDLAKLLLYDRNDQGAISCRVPEDITAGMVLIYARLQVGFPGEPRVVSRSEFTFEVLKYLSQVTDDYTDQFR